MVDHSHCWESLIVWIDQIQVELANMILLNLKLVIESLNN